MGKAFAYHLIVETLGIALLVAGHVKFHEHCGQLGREQLIDPSHLCQHLAMR